MPEALSAMAQLAESATADSPVIESPIGIPTVTPEIDAGGSRLSDLLSIQPEQPVIAIDPAVAPADAMGGSSTLGEKILARLDAVGLEFRTNMERAHEMLEVGPANMSLKDLLKFQMEMSQISLEIELVGKGVQKAVQHVEQLTKLQ